MFCESFVFISLVGRIDRWMIEKDATNNNDEIWHAIAVPVARCCGVGEAVG